MGAASYCAPRIPLQDVVSRNRARDRCHVRDWSLWDDEVAIAVMELYQSCQALNPCCFYSGVVLVKGTDGESRRRASTIANEVSISVKEELHHLVSTEQYQISGFQIQKLNTGDSAAEKGKPIFNAALKASMSDSF